MWCCWRPISLFLRKSSQLKNKPRKKQCLSMTDNESRPKKRTRYYCLFYKRKIGNIFPSPWFTACSSSLQKSKYCRSKPRGIRFIILSVFFSFLKKIRHYFTQFLTYTIVVKLVRICFYGKRPNNGILRVVFEKWYIFYIFH